MASLNSLWAQAIVQELHRGGVRHAVVCPGSRSAPLALACAEQSGLKVWSVVDERTAAFFALGIALETGTPAVVVATSGTAGAHFLPAVMEASASHVPLIVLTADRPWELHDFGAPQTARQENFYGDFLLGYNGLNVPEATDAAFAHLRSVVAKGTAQCQAAPRGPLHFNAPFREPLAPQPSAVTPEGLSALSVQGREQGAPFTEWQWGSAREPQKDELTQVLGRIRGCKRGVIVCGPRAPAEGFAAAIAELSRATGYPVLAEAASGARWSMEGSGTVAQYDLLLRTPAAAKALTPELVLRFGGGLTSKRLTEWLDTSLAPVVLFSEDGTPYDPTHRAVALVRSGAESACRAIASQVTRGPGEWAALFSKAQAVCGQLLQDAFEEQASVTEPQLAFETVRALPEGARLFVASSMPIRDVDAFGGPASPTLKVFSNRGINGIDGTLSSALGVAASSGQPTVVLTGDLAFLHDLNGLLIARRHHIPLTVVVVNNDGGGIFSFLPVAQATPHFEELFGTPHGTDFSHAAALFGARYAEPRSTKELKAALHEHVGKGLSVLNVRVDRHANPLEHQKLYARALAALGELPWV